MDQERDGPDGIKVTVHLNESGQAITGLTITAPVGMSEEVLRAYGKSLERCLRDEGVEATMDPETS